MPPPPLILRPAAEADYHALCGLWRELDEHHRHARPDLFRLPAGPRRERGWVLEQIAGPASVILVAQAAGGRLAGMACLKVEQPPELPVRIVRRHVELHNLVVARTFRRHGVGARLIEAAARWAAAQGVASLELTVHEFNRTALDFYEAAGFQTVRRRLSLPAQSIVHTAAVDAVGSERSPC